MTTNVPPEYTAAELRYRSASDLDEKLAALKEMMVLVPKHKGTERLRVDLKKRLAKLQQQIQKKPKATRTQTNEHIDKEGAGQLVLVGLPNCGKSSLLKAVTNAQPEVADYPYSTFKPTVGMMPFEDIQIQLIDLPPLSEFTEPWSYSLIRNSDGVVILVDLSQPNASEQFLEIQGALEEQRIFIAAPEEYKSKHPEYAGPGVLKKAIVIATKADAEGAADALDELRDFVGQEYNNLVAMSVLKEDSLMALRRALFDMLEIVRVYSKKPGEAPSKDAPYILSKGSTMIQVAKAIHYELAENLKFARIWGSAEFPGQRVERDHVIADGDIIEVHS